MENILRRGHQSLDQLKHAFGLANQVGYKLTEDTALTPFIICALWIRKTLSQHDMGDRRTSRQDRSPYRHKDTGMKRRTRL